MICQYQHWLKFSFLNQLCYKTFLRIRARIRKNVSRLTCLSEQMTVNRDVRHTINEGEPPNGKQFMNEKPCEFSYRFGAKGCANWTSELAHSIWFYGREHVEVYFAMLFMLFMSVESASVDSVHMTCYSESDANMKRCRLAIILVKLGIPQRPHFGARARSSFFFFALERTGTCVAIFIYRIELP